MSIEQIGPAEQPLSTGASALSTPASALSPQAWAYPTEGGAAAEAEVVSAADEKRYATTQLELIRQRFLRNRAALIGGGVIAAFYLTALFANLLAPYGADQRFDSAIYVPPQP